MSMRRPTCHANADDGNRLVSLGGRRCRSRSHCATAVYGCVKDCLMVSVLSVGYNQSCCRFQFAQRWCCSESREESFTDVVSGGVTTVRMVIGGCNGVNVRGPQRGNTAR